MNAELKNVGSWQYSIRLDEEAARILRGKDVELFEQCRQYWPKDKAERILTQVKKVLGLAN